MIEANDKAMVIYKFMERQRFPEYARDVLNYLINNYDLLQKVKFVDDLSYAPNVMMISEVGAPLRSHFFLALNQKNKVNFVMNLAKGISPTSNEVKNLIAEAQLTPIHPSHAVSALSNHSEDLLVNLIFDPWSEIPDWYLANVEDNPYILQFIELASEREEKMRNMDEESVEIELEIIQLKDELDGALAQRDFSACQVYVRRLKELQERTESLR